VVPHKLIAQPDGTHASLHIMTGGGYIKLQLFLKSLQFAVIVYGFLLFSSFSGVRKASANDNALFGIGQALQPYPTNMR